MINNVIVNELKKSPLFNISLCSKELAHSNFWAWLIEIVVNSTHPFLEVFYPDFYADGNCFKEATREKDHIDLKITYLNKKGENKCFLIENKIKSIPTKKQLDDYQEKMNQEFSFGVLTGLEDTLHLPVSSNWSFLSYESIATRIKQVNDANKKTIGRFEYNLINCYCKDISNTSRLLIEAVNGASDRYLTNEDADVKCLEEIRFGDVLLKINASRFKAYLDQSIINNELKLKSSKLGMPFVSTSFNNKQSTITIVYREPLDFRRPLLPDTDENENGRIGIQIQGQQFRIYAGPTNSKSKYIDDGLLKNEFTSFGWFENYKNKLIRRRQSKMTKEYCQYKTQQYLHMYQYWNIQDYSFTDLYEQIKEELIRAKTLIDQGMIHF